MLLLYKTRKRSNWWCWYPAWSIKYVSSNEHLVS